MLVALEPITRLSKDLRQAALTLSRDEARFLVDAYYLMQEQRIRSSNQIRSMAESQEPHEVLSWFQTNAEGLEAQVARALLSYAEGQRVGRWALSVYGIGGVLAAGLLAHIDIEQAPTAGHIWRFAGLDPTCTWNKGEKRPWNASLKVLCWKIGESFKKFSNREDCVYGRLYAHRKAQEVERNEAGVFAEQAATTLAARPSHAQRAIYSQGKLPPGRLDLRAMRYAAKVFLSHYQHVAYEDRFGTPPPKPYVLTHLGHAHYLAPPNWPIA